MNQFSQLLVYARSIKWKILTRFQDSTFMTIFHYVSNANEFKACKISAKRNCVKGKKTHNRSKEKRNWAGQCTNKFNIIIWVVSW